MCWDIIYPQVKRPKPPPADESQPYHLSIRERLIWVLVVAITMLTLAYVVTKLTR